MSERLVYTCSAGFITGICVYALLTVSLESIVALCVTSFLVCCYLIWIKRATEGVRKQFRIPFLIALFALCVSLGFVRYHTFTRFEGDSKLASYTNTLVEVSGVVVEEPEIRETGTRITLRLHSLSEPTGTTSLVHTKILTTLSSYAPVAYGDEIILSGKLTTPENFETDTGRVFNYVSYLAKDRIFYLIKQPKFTVVSHHQGSRVKETLLSIKRGFLGKLDELIVDPESGLMGGLLVSGKQSLPQSILDEFKTVGIVHIVALSGYNVSIIAESLTKVLSFLPRTLALFFGALAMVSFTVMAGAGSTIVRACTMALLVILAKLLNRSYSAPRALLIAGVGMVALNPLILLYDPSFQLSFLATVGIMYVSPIVSKYVTFVPERLKFRETVVATTATQLFVLPYILYSSGELSLVALPVNVLVLFFIPFTMLMGFLSALLGFIHPLLAFPTATAAYVILHYDLWIVSVFAKLPFAAITIPHFSLGMVCVTYVLYAYILIRFHKKTSSEDEVLKSTVPQPTVHS